MHVRIAQGADHSFASITNADTGRLIPGVKDIHVTLIPGEPPAVTLDIVAEIEITAEATVRRLRLNVDTGEYEPTEPEATDGSL